MILNLSGGDCMTTVMDELISLDEEKVFGTNLKEILKKKNMSQSELAEKAGLTGAAVSRYFKGTRIPKVTTAYKIAEALEVTVEELLGVYIDDQIDADILYKLIENNICKFSLLEKKVLMKLIVDSL